MIGKLIKHSIFLAVAIWAICSVGQASLQLFNLPQGVSDLGRKKANDGLPISQITSKKTAASTTAADEIVAETPPKLEKSSKLAPIPEAVAVPPAEKIIRVSDTARAEFGSISVAGVFALTNAERQKFLGAGYDLKENTLLDKAAQAKVDDMLKYQYFEHVSPQGNGASYFVGGTGYAYILIGENLAMGDFDGDADLVAAWMASPGHRANILKAGYKEIGVAVGYGEILGRKTWLAVQEFGTSKTACPAVDKNLLSAAEAIETKLDDFSANQEALAQKIDAEKAAVVDFEKKIQVMVDSYAPYDAVKAKQKEYSRAIDAVNRDVNAYNAGVKEARSIYGTYKSDIEKYNMQVTAFNACVSAFR